jgi:hypothetical protein
LSEAIEKQFQALTSKMAGMEKELATLRQKPAAVSAPPAPAFDARQFLSAYLADPYGTIARMGATPDQLRHVTQVHFAHALGDQAPPELKMLAQLGPQVAATSHLASQIQSLGQRLESFETGVTKKSTRESFSAVAVDKAKYPHLAAAYAADPSLFDSELEGHKGNAAELAESLETRHKKLAGIYGPKTPPASDENAESNDGQSKQAELATQAVGMDPTPPPLPKSTPGVWSDDEHARVRDEIVRKYSSG